jgi:Mg2+ and Co2+ transporter CorA
MSSVGNKSQGIDLHDFEVTFRDSQELQAFQEKLGRVLSALQYNSQVISSLHKKLQIILRPGWHQSSNLTAVENERSWISHLGEIREEAAKCQRNVTALIKRVHDIQILVSPEKSKIFQNINRVKLYRIHDFRNLQVAHELTSDLKQYAARQLSEGERMTRLANRTAQDANIMKIITSVTVFYLPATFVAVRTPS